MSALSLLPESLLESYGLSLVQQAADQAFGSGVLKLSDDSNGISMGLAFSGGQSINIDDLTIGTAERGVIAEVLPDAISFDREHFWPLSLVC